jgi:hypothetical protein
MNGDDYASTRRTNNRTFPHRFVVIGITDQADQQATPLKRAAPKGGAAAARTRIAGYDGARAIADGVAKVESHLVVAP